MTNYSHIYEEVRQPFSTPDDVELVRFPRTCPKCGAQATRLVEIGVSYKRLADYACGGTYREKPQIQNHTDFWWGHCPRTKADQAALDEAVS